MSWYVALAIAAPHVLYAYIWFFPDKWRAAFTSQSVEVFHNIAWALKRAPPEHASHVGQFAYCTMSDARLTAGLHACSAAVQQHRGMAPA